MVEYTGRQDAAFNQSHFSLRGHYIDMRFPRELRGVPREILNIYRRMGRESSRPRIGRFLRKFLSCNAVS